MDRTKHEKLIQSMIQHKYNFTVRLHIINNMSEQKWKKGKVMKDFMFSIVENLCLFFFVCVMEVITVSVFFEMCFQLCF